MTATVTVDLALSAATVLALSFLSMRLRRGQRGVTGWIGSVADITDEHELTVRHSRLSDVIEVTPDLVAVINVNGGLSYLNQAARATWGFDDSDDLDAASILNVYAPGAREMFI